MSAKRLKMRRIRETLRYRLEDLLGHKSIAARVMRLPRRCTRRGRQRHDGHRSTIGKDAAIVIVLGASSFSFAHAPWSETLTDWI